jgi:outer membrane biosynthesis protein TonB
MVAGQKAPHFMIHIIPRKEGDDVGFGFPTKPLAEADVEKLAAAIRRRANTLFGLEAKEPLDLNVKPAKIKAETVQAEFEEEKPGKKPEKKSEPAESGEEPEESQEEEPKPKPKPTPKPKKAEPDSSKSKKSQSPKEKSKEAPAGDPDLDLISRLF